MPISDATRDEAQRLIQRYPVARAALLPMLHLVQSEEGYVSEDGVAMCAQVLGLTKAEVGAVATFYTMYKREPFGDYLLSVCTNPTCKIAGGQDIYDAYVEACGGHVDTSGAGVMVEHAECLGICDAAPVVQINYEMYGPVTRDEAMHLLERARAGDPPASDRSGHVPATFRAVEREFSGIDDGVEDHLVDAARAQALSSIGPSYRSGETDIPVTHPGGDPVGHGGVAFRSQARLGDTEQRPEQQRSQVDEELTEQVAESATGVGQELADQVLTDRPAGESPSVQDQPDLAPRGATPPEAEAGTPVGVESDPSDSIAGEAGAEDLPQPIGDRDTPSGADSEPDDLEHDSAAAPGSGGDPDAEKT
jgi:NADH-quinone oxidoreductase subunit E